MTEGFGETSKWFTRYRFDELMVKLAQGEYIEARVTKALVARWQANPSECAINIFGRIVELELVWFHGDLEGGWGDAVISERSFARSVSATRAMKRAAAIGGAST